MKKLKRRLPTLDYSTLVVALMITALVAGGIGLVRTKALSAGGSCSTAASAPVYFTNYQRWGFQADLYCTTYPNTNRIDMVQFDYPRQAGSSAGGAYVSSQRIPDQWTYNYVNLFVRATPTTAASVGGSSLIVPVKANSEAAIWYLAGPFSPTFCTLNEFQTVSFGFRIHQLSTNSWGSWHRASPAGGNVSGCTSYSF